VVHAFVAAYIAYLSGMTSARALPYSSVVARNLAVGGGRIPPTDRDGRLRLASYEQQGSTVYSTQVLAVAANTSHTYPFTVDATRERGRWLVTQIIPPDLATDDAKPPARPPAASVPHAARTTAVSFVLGYVDYAEGARAALPRATLQALRQIRTGRGPLAGQRQTGVAASLGSIDYGPIQAGRFTATATVIDDGESLTLTFVMRKTTTGWEGDGFATTTG
jgi:hypothetical protein